MKMFHVKHLKRSNKDIFIEEKESQLREIFGQLFQLRKRKIKGKSKLNFSLKMI